MRRGALIVIAFALTASHALAAGPNVPKGTPIDEAYRKQFGVCDKTDTFQGVKFPIFKMDKKTGKPIETVDKKTGKKRKKILWYGCSSDPSIFARFEAIAAAGEAPQTVVIQSKLGHDEDGSAKACGDARGPTDQCETTLMLNPTPSTPCVIKIKHGKPLTTECVPVSADTIPYIVIPAAAPPPQKIKPEKPAVQIDGGKFKSLSKLEIGDYGVVIAHGKVVPVIIADAGPAYKIGEGSTALLKRLSSDGKPHTIGSGVVFILFPKTHDPRESLPPETLLEVVNKKGCDYYRKLGGGGEAVGCN
jgi:Fungal chitosanase of glycosyl hydrolase group 75